MFSKEKLSKIIAEKGITQIQLAEDSGVTQPAISSYLSGDREPTLRSIAKMADALGVGLSEICVETGQEYVIKGIIRVFDSVLEAGDEAELERAIEKYKTITEGYSKVWEKAIPAPERWVDDDGEDTF